jgi:hypothetical protein
MCANGCTKRQLISHASHHLQHRTQVKGELDNVNSHVTAEDALKRRLTRELKLGSAVPPVLDYVANVVKLEKLRLKEKNESKRIEVRASACSARLPPHLCPLLCFMMSRFQFSIVHAECNLVDTTCLTSAQHRNSTMRLQPCQPPALMPVDCR